MARLKKFINVRMGDQVHYLSPVSQTVRSIQVVHIEKYNDTYLKLVVIKNLQYRSELITEEAMILAKDYEDTNIYAHLLLPANTSMAILDQEYPTPISTEKNYIEQWMAGKFTI